MHTFRAAQPALLYLSPACIISISVTALARGEVQTMWSFSDTEEQPEAEVNGFKSKAIQNGDQGESADGENLQLQDSSMRRRLTANGSEGENS